MNASFSDAVWLTITNDIMIRSKTNSLCIPHIIDLNLLPTKSARYVNIDACQS